MPEPTKRPVKRWRSSQARAVAYKFIAQRDGERCLRCGATHRPLEIDHADGDKRNTDPENLSLLCGPCNVLMRSWGSSKHVQLIAKYRTAREREREIEPVRTEQTRLEVDYSTGSVEMQANHLYEVRVRDLTLGLLEDHGPMEKKVLVNALAEGSGSSQLTCTRYLDKMTSIFGALKEYKDVTGKQTIFFKNPPRKRRKAAEE